MFVWMLRQIKRNYGDKSMVVFGSLGIVLSAGGIFVASMTTDSWVTPLPPEPQWVALSQDTIDELVGEGKRCLWMLAQIGVSPVSQTRSVYYYNSLCTANFMPMILYRCLVTGRERNRR
ncbi:hypothetical protein JCM19233_3132 [Vibrio astriarenae]|nr:hypothetical protein JCM19233_3132 [Vibrio sp. C7]